VDPQKCIRCTFPYLSSIDPFKMTSLSIPVPSQTDEAYSAIASNQCSWAAAEFSLRDSELRLSFKKNPDEFVRIYKECLEKASHLRAAVGSKNLYGENIDTPELLDHYKKHSHFTVMDWITIKKNTGEEFLEILHTDLRREFYTREYSERPIESLMTRIFGAQRALVSRHGQSLAVIPFFGRYLICDSHLHVAFVATKEDAVKHILMDNGGHLHLTALLLL
jgi:hypothetical protein